ncbi:DUF6801 domain-containing protein [Nocardioides sp. 616]|uniref:DUF6801 domain-containing protein n=1 Tax=Nocardioides sp. 616 TaxID=2268090 RepID=UPI000CE3A47E|nr:DUF6801 domain-containing protein [Nocardioides sp. 616]
MRNSSLRRSLAAGASIAVAAAGFAAFAPSATAASGNITFNCNLDIGGGLVVPSDFTTVADTNLPASVALGSSTPVAFTSTITVPATTADAARNLLGDTVAGTASIATTINGAAAPATAPVPTTSLGAAGTPLVLSIAGSGTANYVADTAGTKVVKVPNYTAALVFTNSGSTAAGTPVAVSCTAATGADTTVDTFTVTDPNAPVPTPTPTPTPAPAAQDTTTKVVKATYKKKAKKLVTLVQVRNEDKTAAAGDVKLVLKKGNKKIGKTVTVTLNKKGKATNVFTKISKKGKYTLKANYKGADLSKRSKTTYTIKIK